MKKRLFCLFLLTLLPLGGCFHEIENELELLERRIEKLEQRCREMNTTLEGLRTIIEKLNTYDFITKVETLREGGKITGYKLHFTHSNPVTLYNGTDAATPVLGVAKGEDGVWYWTVKYPSDPKATFLTDNFGVRIPTSAATPEIKIENGYWMVTYDGGEIWHNAGRATGEDGVSFFRSVENKGDYILLNLLNGTSVKLPTWSSFEKLQESCRKLNENLEAFSRLVAELNEKVHVSDMVPILNGQDTIGCRLLLTDGTSYTFYNGVATNAPVIGAQQDESGSDGNWYWTIRYGSAPAEWILNENGARIQANAPEGLAPKISLLKDNADNSYYWAVAYGSGQPAFLLCNGARVPASVQVPDPVVLSVVSVSDDKACITLDGGQTVFIPLAKAFNVTFSPPVSGNSFSMGARDTVAFTCTLNRGDGRTEVLPLAENGFYATASTSDHLQWKIVVISPAGFKPPSTSKLKLMVSDGYGALKTVIVTVKAK